MKRILILLVTMFSLVFTGRAQNNVGINDDNSAPKASAMLDVFSANKGLLIPRVALTSTTAAAPVTSPENSLLIYNTAAAGDVTPGYYYWNGSKWVRLVANADPTKNTNMVTKSASATLLKTENMVLASGDITLTLPVITSADDGLEIAIKNVGNFTDLISITGGTGVTIDADQTITITRWNVKTFIARSGNWLVKESHLIDDNIFFVSESGSFTSIAEVVAFLNAHMNGPSIVEIDEDTEITATITIDLPYPVTFVGMSFGETTIQAGSSVAGTPLFICQSECYFKMLVFNAYANSAGNDAIRFTGSGKYYEVKDSYFYGFNKGIVSTSNNDLWVFETDFENCAGAGVEIAAGSNSGGSFKISESDFIQCAKGIHLLSGVSETVSILNCTFYNTTSGTDIGVLYVPATFTTYTSMFFTSNAWNNQGAFFSGFDFSLASGRDANIFMVNNLGSEDEKPHMKLNVSNNATTTTVTTAGTYYKAVWATNASIYTCKWTIGSTGPVSGNRITYQPSNARDAWAIITGNISVNNTNRVITLAIVRNGATATRYGETDLRITAANQPFQFSTVIYIPNLAKNDYLELYCTSSNNGDNVIFQDIQWFANTQ
jgi:hypothetical protein